MLSTNLTYKQSKGDKYTYRKHIDRIKKRYVRPGSLVQIYSALLWYKKEDLNVNWLSALLKQHLMLKVVLVIEKSDF